MRHKGALIVSERCARDATLACLPSLLLPRSDDQQRVGRFARCARRSCLPVALQPFFPHRRFRNSLLARVFPKVPFRDATPRPRDVKASLQWSLLRVCQEDWVAARRIHHPSASRSPLLLSDVKNSFRRASVKKPRGLRRPLSFASSLWLLRHYRCPQKKQLSVAIPYLWDLLTVKHALPLLSPTDLATVARLWPALPFASNSISATTVRQLTDLVDAVFLNVHRFPSSIFCLTLRNFLRLGVSLPLSNLYTVIASRTAVAPQPGGVLQPRRVATAVVILDPEEKRECVAHESSGPEVAPRSRSPDPSVETEWSFSTPQFHNTDLLDIETNDLGFLLGQLGTLPELGGELLTHSLLHRLQRGPSTILDLPSLLWTLTGLMDMRYQVQRTVVQHPFSFSSALWTAEFSMETFSQVETLIQQIVRILEEQFLEIRAEKATLRKDWSRDLHFTQADLNFHVANLLVLLRSPILSQHEDQPHQLLHTLAEELIYDDERVSAETVACMLKGLLATPSGRTLIRDNNALAAHIGRHILSHLRRSPAAAAAMVYFIALQKRVSAELRREFLSACRSLPTREHYRAALTLLQFHHPAYRWLGASSYCPSDILSLHDSIREAPHEQDRQPLFYPIFEKRRLLCLSRSPLPFSDDGFPPALLHALEVD